MTPKRPPKPRPCVWRYEEDPDYWHPGCLRGEGFVLNEGTPTENSMHYCCYCGKPLKEAKANGR